MPNPQTPKQVDCSWKVVTMRDPVMWPRDVSETWLMNPPLRYVINAQQLPVIEDHVEATSSLSTCGLYKPLRGEPLRDSKILVERHRDRGVGDHLFLTGIYKLLSDLTGGTCKIYQYALHSRASWLNGCEFLASEACLTGPLCYDTFGAYDHHWMVDQLTEYTSEPDQGNVYDAAIKSIGIEPSKVSDAYKRPYCRLIEKDLKDLDTFKWRLFKNRGIDLRACKYAIVSPLCNSVLRSIPYSVSLEVIQEIAKVMPCLVLGDDNFGVMPNAGVPYSQFQAVLEQVGAVNQNVVNLLGQFPPRIAMGLVAGSQYIVTADSGLLYVAQGFRVPAVSVWGTHAPESRIGYDKDYMRLAIHKTQACRFSPCYSYSGWVENKCPQGLAQTLCAPMASITKEDILKVIKSI